MVTFIFRHSYSWNNGTCSPSLYKELSRAREHLRHRFANNPVQTRRAVSHAARVIGISRECTSFTPCETMRVFFSFAFILAFATFSPSGQSADPFPLEPPVKLDDLPFQYSGSADAMSRHGRWIEHGGPASLETVDDITDVGQLECLKQAALRSMESLRVWGIAKKFQRIFKNFNYD